MRSINWRRVVVGGLVAGLVINLMEFAFEPLLRGQMEIFFERLGQPAPGEPAMIALAGLSFVLGITAVWLYAAMRPRYGAGAMTATLAGVAVWALSCLFPNIVMYVFGLFTPMFFWLATLCPLVETVVATVAGAWVYREGHASTAAPQPGLLVDARS